MTEPSEAKEPGDAQAVSIAGGSLFGIGFMLWFFTSGIKTEVQSLRNEIREIKESQEKQAKTLQQLITSIDENRSSDSENSQK